MSSRKAIVVAEQDEATRAERLVAVLRSSQARPSTCVPRRWVAAFSRFGGWFGQKALAGGGPLIDIGTHALDLALWTMNNYKPKLVTGSVFQKLKDYPEGNLFGPWDPAKYEVEDSAFGLVKMESHFARN